jgi:hypothetical protein
MVMIDSFFDTGLDKRGPWRGAACPAPRASSPYGVLEGTFPKNRWRVALDWWSDVGEGARDRAAAVAERRAVVMNRGAAVAERRAVVMNRGAGVA